MGVDGRPRLGDFGFAKLKAETFSRTTIWGTPVYTAPEVWEGEYSEKRDVYSLGVILAEILTGKPYSRDIEEKALRSLVERATSHDPKVRPSAVEFAQKLREKLHPLEPATLVVEAERAVTVYVDGSRVGRGSRVEARLKPGEHTVKIDTGSKMITRTVQLNPRQTLTIIVTPQPEEKKEREEIKIPGWFASAFIGCAVGWFVGMFSGGSIGGVVGSFIGGFVSLLAGWFVGGATGVYGILLGILGAFVGWGVAGQPPPWWVDQYGHPTDSLFWRLVVAGLGYLTGLLLAFLLLWARYRDKYIKYAKKLWRGVRVTELD